MAEFDTGFELLPADDAELTPDQALDAAFGEREGATLDNEQRKVPLGRGWLFDFDGAITGVAGQFVRHGRAPAIVDELAHLRVWIEKTLRTARFAHAIYSEQFGTEWPEDMIGVPFNPELAGKISTAVQDALLVHDRITQVKDFMFTGDASDDLLEITFTVVVDEDELTIDSLPIGRSVF